MRYPWMAVALLTAVGPLASGQRLYWGVMAGTGLTPDFPRYDLSGAADSYGNSAYHFQHLPDARSLILGGLFEVQLTNRFSIEANVLHRPLRDTIVLTEFPAEGPAITTTDHYVTANTWEFPLLLKWSLPSPLARGRIRPFVEGGIAFRTSQDVLAVLPSQIGATAGVGAAVHVGNLRVAPTIRYTRWEKESRFPPYPTKPDQLEFLTSVSWGTASEPLRVSGRRLALGLVGGLPLNGEFFYPATGVRERIGYLAGASGQLELHRGLALEADAIYKPLRNSFAEGSGFQVLTWDFPLLVKYHVAKLGRSPFIEAGPSFRTSGNRNGYNPSHLGITVGAGAETLTRWALLSTALRYTRWATDAPPRYRFASPSDYERTNANAVELIVGVGF